MANLEQATSGSKYLFDQLWKQICHQLMDSAMKYKTIKKIFCINLCIDKILLTGILIVIQAVLGAIVEKVPHNLILSTKASSVDSYFFNT